MAVDHIMYIKVIFLGHLRELGQSDQTCLRRLMEDTQISAEELDGLTNAIERVMRDTVTQLREMFDKTDRQLQSAGRDTSKDSNHVDANNHSHHLNRVAPAPRPGGDGAEMTGVLVRD